MAGSGSSDVRTPIFSGENYEFWKIKMVTRGVKRALDTFNTAIVSPIYYAMFTSFTIFASAIMFKYTRARSTFNYRNVR
ncbi:hypothetical protein L3X38_012979 [Prunus dulcis]|uniref:DUF4219 domain-containing protein n=1 Tax=Prunus dulcis TaxID=3755 RepID=A0AAD4WMK7_PRUDU|nr:hypothetical protein L3X38_012979 [Prunus dulcis]